MKGKGMKYMSQIKRICDFLFHANVIKTIIFNFRMLPIKQAIRLPIWLYGRVDIGGMYGGGKIVFSSQQKPHFGGWKIGLNIDFLMGVNTHPYQTRFIINGRLILGEHGRLANGTLVHVRENAMLSLGDDFLLNFSSKIACYEQISIGSHCHISWETQIFDTNFHYMADNAGDVQRKEKPIYIGNNVWIGNRVTIAKGAKLCDQSVVASNSVVNKDFSKQSGVYAGIPAKLVTLNKYRLFDNYQEFALDTIFLDSNCLTYNLDLLDNGL